MIHAKFDNCSPYSSRDLELEKNQNVLNCAKIHCQLAATGGALWRRAAKPPPTHSKMASMDSEGAGGGGREWGRVLHILHLFRQISHCRIVARWGRRRLTKHLKAMEKKKKHATCSTICISRRGRGGDREGISDLLRHYFGAESEAALIADNVEPNERVLLSSPSLYLPLFRFSEFFVSPFLFGFLFTCDPPLQPPRTPASKSISISILTHLHFITNFARNCCGGCFQSTKCD